MTDFNWTQLQNGSDIRGVALKGIVNEPVNLTAERVTLLGKAFGTWLSQQLDQPTDRLIVAVGRDSRLSGEALSAAVTTGLTSLGIQVYDVAIASTPAMFMSTITEGFDCDGAIMLTASHLPFNRNGLKFFTKKGGLDKPDIKAILALAAANEFEAIATPGNVTERDLMAVYAEQLVKTIREGVNAKTNFEQPLKGLKIVVDAGNGSGGFYVDRVLQPLGADTTGSQFLEPDGMFPNHIPNPENETAMAAISAAVTANKADFGIIFDTDVDRGAAVDPSGKELNRNRLIALMSVVVLREHPGSTIVTDSITSDGLATFIEQDLGGVHFRYRRGYKNVINQAIALNESGEESWLAIETSGHGAMKENHFLDDGAYLITKLLVEVAKLHEQGKTITDLIATLQEPVESEEFRFKITESDFKTYGLGVIEKLKDFAAQQENWQIVPKNREGIRVSCKSSGQDGWFLLRLSLHDPVMPLNVESNVKGGVEKINSQLLEFLQKYEDLTIGEFGKV
ncbi:phosphoglucomutase/phosphomannomutase alpha/beta/alpha domain I [[Leptolyngbya] sp. PCC 7376]|uniref:phosphoglucomutase/phosphomannomutase alpha/beta/alpha domain I n=1 Tax=[Leptolyngbya] sp. PCC 7376 TaxID=111781 RepID=UPI00029EDBD6|nr:phosphoglucomutase/phosphomannomutase alpha/beta/alpha domain I [[Leptolyngbya] sp. PCC 7376]AFY37416.1 phosphoglucomutase/phosphomannomutase alpha/beta/alpha domain I [[Leptolyngbya] sp. PCC 7376]